VSVTPPAPVVDEDAVRLAELGYKQELHRGMSGFSNFAVSFSIISVLAGCITSYGIAMTSGGPIAISLGWPLVGVFVLCVALAMGEICSVYPTAGGLYFWAGRLARKNKAVWAWYVGWFNFLGEVAVTAAIDFGAALTWTAFANLDGLRQPGLGLGSDPRAYLHSVRGHPAVPRTAQHLRRQPGQAALEHQRLVAPGRRRSHRRVPRVHPGPPPVAFVYVLPLREPLRLGHPIYVFFIGLLMAQYTYTGFDASAHVAEETHSAATNAPKGIVNSVIVSILAGWVLLVAVTAAIQDYSAELGTATGLPAAQIFVDAAGHKAGIFLIFICGVAQYFCGMASVTANSRMAYAFSRDGALPGSQMWSKVNVRTGTPTNSIWLCTVCALILASPALKSTTAYLASPRSP